jgi:hypothetical protein
MRELALVGVLAVAFALGGYYATDGLGWFGVANLVLGGAALVGAAVAAARRARRAGGGDSRRVVARGVLLVLAALVVAVGAERLAAWSEIQFDWTFEGAFEPAPATVKALHDLPEGVQATLYYDPADPRVRRTRLLLERIAEEGPLEVRRRIMDEHPADLDRFAVGSSNTVVLRLHDRFETVERPTEGTLYEALYRLRSAEGGEITALRGDGEGDLSRTDDLGFAGLAAALATEGYQVRSTIGASLEELPETTDLLLVLAPERRLPDRALDAIRRYLARGGSMVALIEPGQSSGIDEILAEYGIQPTEGFVVDPGRDTDEAPAEARHPVAMSYWDHPITRGLDANRMTYFYGTAGFTLHKPAPDDELSRLVDSSGWAWIDEDLGRLDDDHGTFERDDRKAGYWPLVVSGRYPRPDGGETRIVAFGDADFASNRHLRTLYNLDLVLNAVHWATENEPEITLRPKNRPTPVQFPIPLTNTLETLYGVGLLVPELLLMIGGIIWLRRRGS